MNESRTKIILEGVEEYKENWGIVQKKIGEVRDEVRSLNNEFEQLNKHMEVFADLRKKLL